MPPHATFPPVRFFSLTHQSNHDAYENLSARLLAVQIDMLRCNRWLEFVDRRMQHVAAARPHTTRVATSESSVFAWMDAPTPSSLPTPQCANASPTETAIGPDFCTTKAFTQLQVQQAMESIEYDPSRPDKMYCGMDCDPDNADYGGETNATPLSPQYCPLSP